MSFGAVYSSTNFGNTTNTIGWGKIYQNLIIRPLASTSRIFADSIKWLADNIFG